MLFFVLHISKCIKCVFTSVPSCLLQYGSSGQDGILCDQIVVLMVSADRAQGVELPTLSGGELNVETVFL